MYYTNRYIYPILIKLFMSQKEKESTRLVLVRHLETSSRQIREIVKTDTSAEYVRLMDTFHNSRNDSNHISQAKVDGDKLLGKYGLLPGDEVLPIEKGQDNLGHAIGVHIANAFPHIGRWEISPLLRTRQTSQLIREGLQRENPPKEVINDRLRERNFGDADTYPSFRIYLATHPDELARFLSGKHVYRFPHGESRQDFDRRIGRNVRSLKWRRRYEGTTTVLVTHSIVIEEHIKQLSGNKIPNEEIWTGSITVFEASPKRFLRPRRYTLVGQAGQKVA